MAKRKSGRPRKSRKKTSKDIKRYFGKIVAAVVILSALVFIAAVVLHYNSVQKRSISPQTRTKHQTKHRVKYKIPAFEIYPEEETKPKKPVVKPKPSAPKKLPHVAIIIDDLGYDKRLAEKFYRLEPKLTLSILPYSPHQTVILKSARARGIETMLHLPMEPEEFPRVNPGPGALIASMSPDELIDQLEKNLDALPTVKGVNNHMGSKLTTLSSIMYQIFSVLKKRNLYFIDSRTTAESLCRPSARLLRIPFAQRDIFIDHTLDSRTIKTQIDKLIRVAKSHGQAVGIGHPHKLTYEILRKQLPRLKQKVKLVPASEIVHLVG